MEDQFSSTVEPQVQGADLCHLVIELAIHWQTLLLPLEPAPIRRIVPRGLERARYSSITDSSVAPSNTT